MGIDMRADGPHIDPSRVRALVETSSRIEGVQIVYALLWDDKGHLDPDASSVNSQLLQRISEPLAQLYLRDAASRTKALEILALGRKQPGIRRLPILLASDKQHISIGRLDLGISTAAIDAELKRSLQSEPAVLVRTLILGVMMALWIARRISQPLVDLSGAMGRLREGDFEVRAATVPHGNDEV